jgi:hypothetical protein
MTTRSSSYFPEKELQGCDLDIYVEHELPWEQDVTWSNHIKSMMGNIWKINLTANFSSKETQKSI